MRQPIPVVACVPPRRATGGIGCVCLVAGLATGAALAPVCLGQPTDPASTDPAPPPVLTGPTVETGGGEPTLVRGGYDGRIERVEDAQPEVAALELVDLETDVRARIDARLEERAAFMDRVVIEEYRTLLELYTAFGAGDQAEVIRLYVDFTSHLAPLFEGGSLGRQLADEMPNEAGRRYAGILREYYRAVVDDALEHPEEMRPGSTGTRGEVLRNYKVELLMQEVGRSFARIIEQKTGEVEEVLAALDLTPEREAEVRATIQTYGQEMGLNPTAEQKREFFLRLMSALRPEERQRLMGWVLR